MKFVHTCWLLSAALALLIGGCKGPEGEPTTIGPGTRIDENGEIITSVDAGDMSPPEDQRVSTSGGVDRGKFEAIRFDYDSAVVRQEDRAKLEEIARWAKENSSGKLIIEGHCDERGTPEYNRALGQRRALAARAYLLKLGISAKRISTVSYGEDRPVELAHEAEAWTKNRRAEFGVTQ